MKITSIHILNLRKLLQCRIDFSKETTLFVGANNSGKTSAMDALGKFLAKRSFVFNDITISNRSEINKIGEDWAEKECEMPKDLKGWEPIVPKMDVWLEVSRNEIHYVASIIPTPNHLNILTKRIPLFAILSAIDLIFQPITKNFRSVSHCILQGIV